MPGILTEQDTFFGSIAFRDKLITREQLGEGVRVVQSNPGTRLGAALVQLGYMTDQQVDAVMGMQKEQRHLLEERQAPPARPVPPVAAVVASPRAVPPVEAYDPHAIELPEEPADSGRTLRLAPVSPPPPQGAGQPKHSIASALKVAREAIGLGESAVAQPLAGAPHVLDIASPIGDSRPSHEAPPMGNPVPMVSPAPPLPETAQSSEKPVAPPVCPAKAAGVGSLQLASAGGAVKPPSELRTLFDYLTYARFAGASDLHISAEVQPFLRRFGGIVPIDVAPMKAVETEHLLFEVLGKEQKTHLLDRMGLECCIDIAGQGRCRASIFKQRLGWDGVFHIIRTSVPTFEELGLPECMKRLTEYQQGLVLITGPGNSGKTTTLAAMVNQINRHREDHVITVEKPVEYVHTPMKSQVTQREVGTHTDSFSTALRAALREDPDIIMVGELRDLETLSMAITASETGHLVLGTLHTTSATSTINRILDGFPVPQQPQIRMMLSESLRGVISQQLVPRKDGQGQVLALEILLVTPAVSSLIRDNQPYQIASVMQTSRKLGMRRMEDSLLELADSEIIDGMEAYRRAANKQPLEKFRARE